MNNQQRVLSILHNQPCDRIPVVHFGYWRETLAKWAAQGHIAQIDAENWRDSNAADYRISTSLGFDFNWSINFNPGTNLQPAFPIETIATFADGSMHQRNNLGVTELVKPGLRSIPAEIEHLLKDRASWEEHYRWRMQWNPERITRAAVPDGNGDRLPLAQGGLEYSQSENRTQPLGLFCGSLLGILRNIIGLVGMSYMMVDDEDLFTEIIETNAELCYQNVKAALETGAKFDFAHFWEDICGANGPLISPAMFREKFGPHYRRITDLLKAHGVDIVSVDCDGKIDLLIPVWLENGVNTMFPIEVGAWNASFAPWRRQYGEAIRGVGGVDKRVFCKDRAAIDKEIDRLLPMIEMGGYIPCIDHRLPPESEWDLVSYYCDQARQRFVMHHA